MTSLAIRGPKRRDTDRTAVNSPVEMSISSGWLGKIKARTFSVGEVDSERPLFQEQTKRSNSADTQLSIQPIEETCLTTKHEWDDPAAGGDCFVFSPNSVSSPTTTASLITPSPSKSPSLLSRFRSKIRSYDKIEKADDPASEILLDTTRSVALAITQFVVNATQASSLPYVTGIAGVASLILKNIDNVIENKISCNRIKQGVHRMMQEIATEESTYGGAYPDNFKSQMDSLKETLEKVLSTMMLLINRRSSLMGFVKQGDDKQLIQRCECELEQALGIFSFQSTLDFRHKLDDLDAHICALPEELKRVGLDQRAASSEVQKEEAKSTCAQEREMEAFARLPVALPPIFGRDSEVDTLLKLLTKGNSARVAILGDAGIGKSTLALTLLHHVTVVELYGAFRFFVPCDSTTSADRLVTEISSQLGLSNIEHPDRNILTMVLSYLKEGITKLPGASGRALIILDNFEMPWWASSDRKEVEKVLSHLAALENLTIVITMRGTERPQSVKWDRFDRLKFSLDRQSARLLFLEISEIKGYPECNDDDEPDDLDRLLEACDYIPLPITLMARLIQSECETLQSLWKRRQKLPILNLADGRMDNMTSSIQLSVDSPRVKDVPGAHRLLGVMALLPDGMEPEHLEAATSQDETLFLSKNTLLRTSLIYNDNCGRLRMHALIRDYVLSIANKRASEDAEPLKIYLWDMLKRAWKDEYVECVSVTERSVCTDGLRRLRPELGNIEALTLYSLDKQGSVNSEDAIYAAFDLAALNFQTSLGTHSLLKKVQGDIEKLGNKRALADSLFLTAKAYMRFHINVKESSRYSEVDLEKALRLYEEIGCKTGRAECLRQLAEIRYDKRQFNEALELFEKATDLHREVGNLVHEANSLTGMVKTLRTVGDITKAVQKAEEALAIFKETSDSVAKAQCLELLCKIYHSPLCDYTKAEAFIKDSLEIYDNLQLQDTPNDTDSRVTMGEIALALSKLSEAREAFRRAVQVYRKAERRDREAYALVLFGQSCFDAQHVREAHEKIEEGLDLWRKIKNTWGEANTLRALAGLAVFEKKYADAAKLYENALNLLKEDSKQWTLYISECLLGAGMAYLRAGQRDAALTYLNDALKSFQAPEHRRGLADCERYLCELDLSSDDEAAKSAAVDKLKSVQESYAAMGLRKEADECRLLVPDERRRGPKLHIII